MSVRVSARVCACMIVCVAWVRMFVCIACGSVDKLLQLCFLVISVQHMYVKVFGATHTYTCNKHCTRARCEQARTGHLHTEPRRAPARQNRAESTRASPRIHSMDNMHRAQQGGQSVDSARAHGKRPPGKRTGTTDTTHKHSQHAQVPSAPPFHLAHPYQGTRSCARTSANPSTDACTNATSAREQLTPCNGDVPGTPQHQRSMSVRICVCANARGKEKITQGGRGEVRAVSRAVCFAWCQVRMRAFRAAHASRTLALRRSGSPPPPWTDCRTSWW